MGVDWIKIMASGAIMNPGATPGIPIIFEHANKRPKHYVEKT